MEELKLCQHLSQADVALKFGSDPEPAESTAMEKLYAAKPEIQHVFRQPEPRPPAILSQAFTVACVLPIILAFVLVRAYVTVYEYRNMPLSCLVFVEFRDLEV